MPFTEKTLKNVKPLSFLIPHFSFLTKNQYLCTRFSAWVAGRKIGELPVMPSQERYSKTKKLKIKNYNGFN